MTSTHNLDKLIAETRTLAAEFRRQTGQSLPVTGELARYDVKHIGFFGEDSECPGVDCIGAGPFEGMKLALKSRVLTPDKTIKITGFNLEGEWEGLLLVLYNTEYVMQDIQFAKRAAIIEALNGKTQMSLNRFYRAARSMLPELPPVSP